MGLKEGDTININNSIAVITYVGENVIQVIHNDGTRQTIIKAKIK